MLNTTQLLTNLTSFQPLTATLEKSGLNHFTTIVDTANNMLFGSNGFDYEVLSDLTHATAEFINDDFSIYQGLVNSELFELPKQESITHTYINDKHPVIDSGFLVIAALSICYDAINARAIPSQSLNYFGAANELIGIARTSTALIDKLDQEQQHLIQIKKLTPKPPMSNADKARLKAKQFNERCDEFLNHLEEIAQHIYELEPNTPVGAITRHVHEHCFFKKRQLKALGLELPSEEHMKAFLVDGDLIPDTAKYKGRAPFKPVNIEAPAGNYAQLVAYTLQEYNNPLLNL